MSCLSAAVYERDLASERTKAALWPREPASHGSAGPRSVTAAARRRIDALRAEGCSWRVIAETMTDEGWPTGQGGARWHPTTVRRLWLADRTDQVAA